MNLLPGTILAQRYRVDALLGEGGMGAVYRATDWRGAACALKVMRPERVADPDIRRRFEQEAQIGMQLRHPNVRQVWDAGVDGYTQLPYLAMELLYGEDLSRRLAWRGALTLQETGYLLAQLCDALAAAHAAGVIHRDLKPENLFLAASYSGEVLKVLDFGIAKVMAGPVAQNSVVMGTPAWMAPEQLGEGSSIGPPTDVWAVGLLAFFALTGRSYWPSANAATVSYGSIIVEVLDRSARAAASARAAEYGLEGAVPSGAFDRWFAACTAVDPGERFRDVASCWGALREVLGAAPGAQVSLGQGEIAELDEEDAVVAHAIAEIERRMPAALTSVRDDAPRASATPAPRDSTPSQDPARPRQKIPLIKGQTPVPSGRVSAPTPVPALVYTPVPDQARLSSPGALSPVSPDQALVWNTPYPSGSYPLALPPPASKGARAGAAFVDLVLAVLGAIFLGLAWHAGAGSGGDSVAVFASFALLLVRDVLGGGRSLGKRAFDLEIVDVRTGQPVGIGEALARQLASFQVVPGLGLIDAVMVISRDDGRRSGDLVARTQVVKRS